MPVKFYWQDKLLLDHDVLTTDIDIGTKGVITIQMWNDTPYPVKQLEVAVPVPHDAVLHPTELEPGARCDIEIHVSGDALAAGPRIERPLNMIRWRHLIMQHG